MQVRTLLDTSVLRFGLPIMEQNQCHEVCLSASAILNTAVDAAIRAFIQTCKSP